MFKRFGIRQWVFTSLAAILAGYVAAPALAQGKKGGGGGGGGTFRPSFKVYELSSQNSTSGVALDINENNAIVGYLVSNDEQVIPAYWTFSGSGRSFSSNLTQLQGGNCAANGINEWAEIVGGNATEALYWSSPSSSPVALPELSGSDHSFAIAISNSGLIVGRMDIAGVPSVVVWQVSPTSISAAQTISDFGLATGLRDAGSGIVEIVGNDLAGDALVWTVTSAAGQTPQLLTTHVLASPGSANDISPSGFICGSRGSDRAGIWNGSQFTKLTISGSMHSEISRGVNDSAIAIGDVVQSGVIEAVVWTSPNDSPTLLDKYLKGSSFVDISNVWDINNSNMIVGQGYLGNQNSAALVAIPQ